MCGIAGILKSSPDADVLRQRLFRMQIALHHRGPDDSGLWLNSKGSIGLAHTRLSILDLSPGGASADGFP